MQCSVTSHHTDEGTMDFGFGLACGRESGSMRLRTHNGMNREVGYSMGTGMNERFETKMAEFAHE